MRQPWRKTGGPCTLDPTEADWALVVENRGLMYAALKKCGVPFEFHEDCVSDFGYRTMLRCARAHDPARGKFSTLVMNAMGWSVHNWRVKRRRRASLAHFVSSDRLMESGWDLPVEDAGGREFDARQTVGVLLAGLDERHRRAVTMRHCEGKTLDEVGKEFGVCRERAHQLINEGMAVMRAAAR